MQKEMSTGQIYQALLSGAHSAANIANGISETAGRFRSKIDSGVGEIYGPTDTHKFYGARATLLDQTTDHIDKSVELHGPTQIGSTIGELLANGFDPKKLREQVIEAMMSVLGSLSVIEDIGDYWRLKSDHDIPIIAEFATYSSSISQESFEMRLSYEGQTDGSSLVLIRYNKPQVRQGEGTNITKNIGMKLTQERPII